MTLEQRLATLAHNSTPVMVPRPPDAAQLAELERVQGMQVRTNALQFAIAARGGTVVAIAEIVADATILAGFITGRT